MAGIGGRYDAGLSKSPDITKGINEYSAANRRNQDIAENVQKLDLAGGAGRSGRGSESSDEYIAKKAFVLEERAHALAAQSKYYEAASVLEQMPDVKQEQDFGIKLLMAECYVQLGRENKAMKAMKDIRKRLLTPPSVGAEDVMSLAESYRSDTTFLRAMILFRLASEMYKSSTNPPNDIVDGIFRCICLARKAVSALTESKSSSGDSDGMGTKLLKMFSQPPEKFLKELGSGGEMDPAKLLKGMTKSKSSGKLGESSRLRVIVLDFGIDYMKEMLDDLRSVSGADEDKKTLKVAWSATHIGYILANLDEYGKSYRIRKEGCDAMERHFGGRAGQHKVYGVLLHNMGVVLHNSQKYSEAEAVYQKALEAKEMTLDYDENEKEKDIELSRKALRNTRQHMK